MSELTTLLPPELKTKSASKLLGVVLIKLIKQEIFEKFNKTGTLSKDDQEFCDKIDWYPIDELELKDEYIEKLKNIEEGPHIPITLKELDKLTGLK